MTEETFISINLSTNKPDEIKGLFANVESTASHPEQIEIVIHIDKGDTDTKQAILSYKKSSKLTIKYLETDLVHSFADLWKVYNHLLALNSRDSYFVTLFSDEFRFKTKGWDDLLAKYKHYYKDDIFRVRASKFRFRNYSDIWECGLAPDSIAFHTKKWMDIVETWCPCGGPDSFHQCVSFYMHNNDAFSQRQWNRDIADPFLEFSGEGGSVNLDEEAKAKRREIEYKAWFTLMSKKMQEKAKKAAMKLSAHIYASELPGPVKIKDHERKKCILLKYGDNKIIRFPYRARTSIGAINLYRKLWNFRYYCAEGKYGVHANLLIRIRQISRRNITIKEFLNWNTTR